MSSVTVREASRENVAEIRDIAERGWDAAYAGLLSEDAIAEAMADWYGAEETRDLVERDDVLYYVAERDGDVLGYVSGGSTDEVSVASLGAIYVDPDHWGEGIGSTLLARFEAACSRRDHDEVRIRVLAENDVGLSFYRKHGYEIVESGPIELFGETVDECVLRGRICR